MTKLTNENKQNINGGKMSATFLWTAVTGGSLLFSTVFDAIVGIVQMCVPQKNQEVTTTYSSDGTSTRTVRETTGGHSSYSSGQGSHIKANNNPMYSSIYF
ncbi:MAG: hypothetical protein LBC44_01160 [Mycoplasmataceae bacterium]|jgi:hypothetical protein|nr:hypothetical protein [Mycoplasmataceae bacterium]